MKRLKKYTVYILLTALMLSAAAFSAAADTTYIKGDAQGDGSVTVLDATTVQKKLADLTVYSFNEKAADVDGNGLDINDATLIQRYVAQFDDSYGIGKVVTDKVMPTRDEYELPFIPNK